MNAPHRPRLVIVAALEEPAGLGRSPNEEVLTMKGLRQQGPWVEEAARRASSEGDERGQAALVDCVRLGEQRTGEDALVFLCGGGMREEDIAHVAVTGASVAPDQQTIMETS